MLHLENYENFTQKILIIIDVQKSFNKFFSSNFVEELRKYSEMFTHVYQVFDNHHEGDDVDKDYLYDETPELPVSGDLYKFPNEKGIIEKRYNYDVDIDFYRKIVTKEVYEKVKYLESSSTIKRGAIFPTTEGTLLVYIGNNHKWFHVPKKLYNLLKSMKGKIVYMAGGSRDECFLDIETTAKSLGVNIKIDYKYTYSASGSMI